MLQRSPSYILSLPSRDAFAQLLRRHLPERTAYAITRWRNVLQQTVFFQLSRRRPALVKRLIRKWTQAALPAGFDVDTHFKPRYDPWDQRVCLVPDGDLFRALSEGRADIVTDRIRTVTEDGLELESGRRLAADVIVTATGLNIQLFGGMDVAVDGRSVDFADTVAYKGMMFSGVPNLALSIGYTNASWTLKCDLICEYVCRLIAHMDSRGYDYCVPVAPDPSAPLEPLLDFSSGYVVRALDRLPKQGPRPPWRLNQNWFKDIRVFRHAPLEDEGISFRRAPGTARGAIEAPARVAA
jgi:cation diffusion facilitator CzcD-associated flavoprotein CzcO